MHTTFLLQFGLGACKIKGKKRGARKETYRHIFVGEIIKGEGLDLGQVCPKSSVDSTAAYAYEDAKLDVRPGRVWREGGGRGGRGEGREGEGGRGGREGGRGGREGGRGGREGGRGGRKREGGWE